jgi:cytochrome c oxidase assembly factor 3, animal type
MSELKESQVKGLNRKLKQSEIDFMKLIEEQNVQRVLKLKKTRRNNIFTGMSA